MTRRFLETTTAFFMMIFVASVCFSRPAQALDKRLKLAMKTAGYGAAAGLVIGAGTMALGVGDYRNILMGASSGMYAGILLAAYVIAMPDEREDQERRARSRNPYAPRRPIDPDDYEDADEEDLRDHLPRRSDDEGAVRPPIEPIAVLQPAIGLKFISNQIEKDAKGQQEKGVWAPLLSLHW